MASIQKRKNSYAVIYWFKDKNGITKQKWETCATFKAAKKRKAEVENQLETDQFIEPSNQTLESFLDTFIEVYGPENWSPSTYSKNVSAIKNYIVPYIGKVKLQDVNVLMIQKYYSKLSQDKANDSRYESSTISSGTVLRVHKLLKTAFKCAKLWDLINKDPYEKVPTPKHEYKKRDIWNSDTILQALRVCDDPKLTIAIHLSFACSLRIGEILGLQWKNVHIEDEDIENDNARLDVVWQLEELSRDAIRQSKVGEIFLEFPSYTSEPTKTVKVLKSPKTKSSIRTVWIPNTLAMILQKWKQEQQNYKEFFEGEYHDYDLVVCFENGRPCSNNAIRASLNRLIKENDLPFVTFHSFRHASTTYKLKLNHGDIKATQGDTGHAQADMITDLYAHILDEDRKMNAQRFDESFYTQTGEQVDVKSSKVNIDELINAFKSDPALLQQVLSALK